MTIQRNRKAYRNSKMLLASVSTIAFAAGGGFGAYAQDAEDALDEEDVIVVQGIRRSLQNAQDLKRNSDTFVDAITAADIGALPDRSVAEALQRVPGVNVLRFAGPDDPDHFAVEGANVTIRGLPFVRSELNGRDVFGANSGGVLGFEDVSPELLGSVVVFKNQSADLVEGGVAGTIDLRTRVPFDQEGRLVSVSLEGNYGDFRKNFTPTVSGLVSDRWETNIGEFGLMLNGAFTQIDSRADAVSISDYLPDDFSNPTTFVPGGGGLRSQKFDRERLTLAAAAQWESVDRRWLATFQFLRSDSELLWGENVTETIVDNSGIAMETDPPGGINSRVRTGLDQSDFVFDDDGVFRSGTISDNNQWRGPNGTAAFFPSTGGQHSALFRERLEEDVTTDFGFNLKFAPSDNLRFNFDAQYIDSKADITDVTVHGSFFAPLFIDATDPNAVPTFTYQVPAGEASGYFQDPSNFFLRSSMDHITDNEANSLAFRGDVEYDFSGDGWLKSVRAGGRYSRQDNLLRQTDFNWGNISEVWTGRDAQGFANGVFDDNQATVLLGGNPNPDIEAAVSPFFSGFAFDNFQRGGFQTGLGGAIPFYSGPAARDYEGWVAVIEGIRAAAGGATGNGPYGGLYATLGNRQGTSETLIPGTVFFPSEVGNVERDNWAAYVRFDYGIDGLFGPDTGLEGNFGVRYVNTDRAVDTVLSIPDFDSLFPSFNLCDPNAMERSNPNFVEPGICSEDVAALQAFFGTGRVTTERINTSYDYFLPSFNARADFGSDIFMRFGASRTLSRPGIDEVFQRLRFGVFPDTRTTNAAGDEVGVFNGFTAQGIGGSPSGNASLLPQLAWNFDLSWEWYFAPTGSVTVNLFHKTVSNFISFEPTTLTAEGFSVARNTSVNSQENAQLRGVEFAYQQFYDFLPGPLSGLGAQLNYTYIDADGVEPVIDANLPAEDDIPVARFAVDRGIFPRVSEHNLNIIGLYEKGPWQGRVAYNWRSEFQLTSRDVIFPFASVYQPATGQLDASLFYRITENWKVGAQAVNILDDITVTEQSINEAGLRAPRNYFRNDRRVTFVLRATY